LRSHVIEEEAISVVDLLRRRVEQMPDKRAFTFLLDGDDDERHFTYGELDLKARGIACYLQRQGFEGERALLMYAAGDTFLPAFFGCLYAGVVAVPLYPPRRNQNPGRLEPIIESATPRVLMADGRALHMISNRIAGGRLEALHHFATDRVDASACAEEWSPPVLDGDSLCYLQYTSGSTGDPKGVMVSHGNLLRNSLDLDRGFNHDDESVLVTWLPTFHDLGLIYGAVQPVYKGIPCVMLSAAHFLQHPIRWLRAISRYRGTHSAAPNFAYGLCVKRISEAERRGLDLTCWRMALNGSEPVRAEVQEAFLKAFEPCGLRRTTLTPGYGLAEATLKVTTERAANESTVIPVSKAGLFRDAVCTPHDKHDCRLLVGCGGTEIDTDIRIVNPATAEPCVANTVGEIWLAGSTVAQGYWNRPDATEQTFRAMLKNGEGPFLRTGDLGFLKAGQLFITGRLKDTLILYGQNHYPQDIETTATQSHDALVADRSAAFSVERSGAERLVVVAELERRHRQGADHCTPEFFESIILVVQEDISRNHGVRVFDIVLIRYNSIPKTSSGKIKRRACRQAYEADALNVVFQRSDGRRVV